MIIVILKFIKAMIFKSRRAESIYYETMGNGKTPVLFLHGFAASHLTWSFIKNYFDKEKYLLIFVDLLGHGFSSADKKIDYSILNQAMVIYEFIKYLKLDNPVIIGHSYGGGIALLMQIIYGEEIDTKRLILIDAGAYPNEIPFFVKYLQYSLINSIIFAGALFIPKRLVCKIVLKKLYRNKNIINEDRIQNYVKFLRRDNIFAIIKTAEKMIPNNIEQHLQKYPLISVKSLIIWGRNDGVINLSAGERLNSAIPNSMLKVIDYCGHIPQEEKPAETFRLLEEFLPD
ncbi:MAG: alpha/beta hydrolase [Ignavibacteria bacterium]|nr:alpha/beta hydrolase [Ignavibacteria bacterium]